MAFGLDFPLPYYPVVIKPRRDFTMLTVSPNGFCLLNRQNLFFKVMSRYYLELNNYIM